MVNEENLDFNTEPAVAPDPGQNDLLNYTTDTVPYISKPLVDTKAIRAHFALASDSPGLEMLKASIQNGEEKNVREMAALKETEVNRKERDKLIHEVALNKGGDINPDQADFLNYFKEAEFTSDPETVIERKYADNYQSAVLADSRVYQDAAAKAPPSQVAAELDRNWNLIAFNQMLAKHSEDLKQDYENSSWASYAIDWAQLLAGGSLLQATRTYWPEYGGDPAANMRARADYIWQLPLEKANEVIKQDIAEIKKWSYFDAMAYLNAIQGMTAAEGTLYNAGVALDSTVVGAVGARAIGSLRRLLGDTAKATINHPNDAGKAFEAAGKLDKAAEINVAKQKLVAKDPLLHGIDMGGMLPLHMNPKSILSFYDGHLATEATQRLLTSLKAGAAIDSDIAFNMARLDRLPPEVVRGVLFDRAKELFPVQYPRVSDSVIQFEIVPGVSNANFLRATIAKRDGTLFKSEAAANKAAEEYGLELNQYTTGKADKTAMLTDLEGNTTGIRQQGDGWYIHVSMPMDETDLLVRQNIAIPTSNQNPLNFRSYFLGGLSRYAFGGAEAFSKFQQANRELATHTPLVVRELLTKRMDQIGRLRKSSLKDLDRVLARERDFTNPETGVHGRRAKTQAELEQDWSEVTGRLPSEKESLAYWTYHQMEELEHAVFNLGVHRDLSRQGIENWSVKLAPTAEGDTVYSPNFWGKLVRSPDWDAAEDFGVYVMRGDKGSWYSKANNPNLKAAVDKMIERGWQVIQVPDFDMRPLRDILGEKRLINYVVTRNAKSSPLPLNLIEKRDGAPLSYPHAYRVVQGKVARADFGKPHYFGDEVAMLAYTEWEAKAYAANLEKLQKMLRDKVPDEEVRAFVERNLPGDTDWIKEFGEGGRLSLDDGAFITWSKRNVSSLEADSRFKNKWGNIVDFTKSPLNLMRNVDTTYLQERTLPALQGRVLKSSTDPIYKIEKAESLNPLNALQKNILAGMNTLHMADAKTSAIEQWVSQFADLAKDTGFARRHPFHFFFNADSMLYTNPVGSVTTEKLIAAKNARQRILQFIGTQDPFTKELNWLGERIYNSVPGNVARWAALHEYPRLKDPVQYMRNAMFHAYFGVFNPKQWYRQSQGVTYVVAHAGPADGLPAAAATVLQRTIALSENPAVHQHAANIAGKQGFKPEWFLESYRFIRDHGANIVAGEQAMLSEVFSTKIRGLKGQGGKLLGKVMDLNLFPFSEGERWTKMAGYNAAYLKWRKANPDAILYNKYGVINREYEREITRSANQMYNNMSRAGNTAIEENRWASVPLQYSTWQRRLFDQMWGKEVPFKDKARIMLWQSIWYGVPMGVGLAVPWPIYDHLRQEALDRGYDISTTFYRTFFGGLQNEIVRLATGRDYDVTRSAGPSNFSVIYDLLKGDDSFWETALGPLGSFTNSALKGSFPLWAVTGNFFTNGSKDFPPVKEDLLDAARTISAANSWYKAYMMLNYQKFVNRSGATLVDRRAETPPDARDALITLLLGADRQDWADAQLMKRYARDIDSFQKRLQQDAVREIRRGYEALAEDDVEKYEKHMTRAHYIMTAYGDFTPDLMNDTFRKGTDIDADLLDRANRNMLDRGLNSRLPAKFQKYYDIR